MTREQFNQWLNKAEHDDYIIIIKVKQTEDSPVEELHEILTYDGNYNLYEWQNVWYEGQHFVEFLGYIPVDKIDSYYLF